MIAPDAVHVLLQEHDEMRRLCTGVRQVGGYRAAAEVGLRIPRDMSVHCGIRQQLPLVTGLLPGLTTVQLQHYEMGVWAAHQLLSMTTTTPGRARQARLRAALVRRTSVTSPPEL